jgi:hypothetical protein
VRRKHLEPAREPDALTAACRRAEVDLEPDLATLIRVVYAVAIGEPSQEVEAATRWGLRIRLRLPFAESESRTTIDDLDTKRVVIDRCYELDLALPPRTVRDCVADQFADEQTCVGCDLVVGMELLERCKRPACPPGGLRLRGRAEFQTNLWWR